MADHNLKITQPWFDYVVSGKKTFEVRKNDRNFRIGDLLILREYDPSFPEGTRFTGRHVDVYVTLIVEDEDAKGIQSGYCVLGIKLVDGGGE